MQEYLGPEIISHLTLHGNNIAEVIKQLIAVLRKKDENVFLLYLEALKRVRHQFTGLECIEIVLMYLKFKMMCCYFE